MKEEQKIKYVLAIREMIRTWYIDDINKWQIVEKETGLTLTQAIVLRKLLKNNGVILTELANICGLNKSTINGIVKRIQRKGYVDILGDKHDRRIHSVYVTEKGKEVYARSIQIALKKSVYIKRIEEMTEEELYKL